MLKVLPCALLLMPALLFAAQEQPEKWQRVYTGDDSIIEIDVSSVTFAEYRVHTKVKFAEARFGRVKFRTIFSKIQISDEKPILKYKTRLETIEFQCRPDSRVILYREQTEPNNMQSLTPVEYRIHVATLKDARDRIIESYDEPTSDWKPIKFGSMMDKLGRTACTLIEEKRRNP